MIVYNRNHNPNEFNRRTVDRCLHTDTDQKPNVSKTQSWNLCVSGTRVHNQPVIPIERV